MARVESGAQTPTDGSCLEFYYYMEGDAGVWDVGDGVGTLNVYVRRGEFVDAKPVWTLSQTQGKEWMRTQVRTLFTPSVVNPWYF